MPRHKQANVIFWNISHPRIFCIAIYCVSFASNGCHSVVLCFQMDMITQGDSVYDIIDTRDHDKVRSNLLTFNPGYRSSGMVDEGGATDSLTSSGTARDDRVFFCRMSIARSCRRQTGPTEHKVCTRDRINHIQSSVFLC